MPALNAEGFLAAAIESVLAQNMGDLELIVIDDGSQDGSCEIARAFERHDRRVSFVGLARDPATMSGARASNVGLERARGDFIARMDADDIAPATRLADQLAAIRDRGLDVCGGQVERFGDGEGQVWFPQGHDALANELVFRAAFPLPTLLARAEIIKRARFSETAAYEEYELQTRLVADARLGNAPEVVLRIRCHAGQTTRVLHPAKAKSHWRSRFRYFFGRFPDASLDDFRCVNALPWGTPLAARADLERAASWLVRLSRLPDARLRQRMARRWTEACDLAGAPAGLRADFEARILAPP